MRRRKRKVFIMMTYPREYGNRVIGDEELLIELLTCKTQKEAMLNLGLGVGGESYRRCRRIMEEHKSAVNTDI